MDQVNICNQAIGLVGGNPIMAITDASIEGRLCNTFWEGAVRYVLEARDWTFASARARLSTPSPDTPISEYNYAFLLPVECMVLRQVHSDISMQQPSNYVLENRYILTDDNPIYIRYTYGQDNPEIFPAVFVSALVSKLAELIAPSLTGNASLAQSKEAATERYLQDAGGIDGSQGMPKIIRRSNLISARYTGSLYVGETIENNS